MRGEGKNLATSSSSDNSSKVNDMGITSRLQMLEAQVMKYFHFGAPEEQEQEPEQEQEQKQERIQTRVQVQDQENYTVILCLRIRRKRMIDRIEIDK